MKSVSTKENHSNGLTARPAGGDAPALERGLRMLELLARHPEGLPQTKVAEILGAPDSSVMRLGRVLADLGYVTRCEKSRRFTLARKFLAMAQGWETERNLIEIALPIMRELRDDLRESVLLGTLVPELGVGFTLAMVRSVHPFAFHVEPGTPFHVHASGPGKAMLAALPEDRLQELLPRLKLERMTAQTITSRKALMEEIAKVRRAGYAVDDGEYFDGCVCLGVAIPGNPDFGVNAIWVTGPDNRFKPSDLSHIAPRVMAAARRIGDQALATPRLGMAAADTTPGRFLGNGRGEACPDISQGAARVEGGVVAHAHSRGRRDAGVPGMATFKAPRAVSEPVKKAKNH